MPDTTVFTGNVTVGGQLQAGSFVIPTSSVVDASVGASANIAATKLEHEYVSNYSQKTGVVVATARDLIHIAKGNGTIVDLKACLQVALTGDGTAVTTVKLFKNGSDITSAQIAFTTGTVAFALLTATISPLTFVAGDVFELSITATANTGTLGQGLYVRLVTREAP